MTCHLGIDRGTFNRALLEALNGDPNNLSKLAAAPNCSTRAIQAGEDLGFDPNDIPNKPTTVKLSAAKDPIPAIPVSIFLSMTKPTSGAGASAARSATAARAIHRVLRWPRTPNDAHAAEEWEKQYKWDPSIFGTSPCWPSASRKQAVSNATIK